MRPLGLAVQRYSNLPYQGWEVKPDTKSVPGGAAPNAVLLSITAAVVMVELCVKVRDSFNGLGHISKMHFKIHMFTCKKKKALWRRKNFLSP